MHYEVLFLEGWDLRKALDATKKQKTYTHDNVTICILKRKPKLSQGKAFKTTARSVTAELTTATCHSVCK